MPGPTSHGGWRRHIRMARNAAHDAYGAMPGSPSWQTVPILANGMTLKATSPRHEPATNIGGDFRRHVAVRHRQVVEGEIATLLWPELTQLLLDAALLRVDSVGSNYQDVYGHVVDHFTPADPRRYLGVVVDRARLEVSRVSGHEARLTLSCLGQREEENDSLTESNFDYSSLTRVPFMGGTAAIQVGGETVADVEDWTLTVENNVGESPFTWSASAGASVRAHAIANKRTVTLELSDLNNDDEFNEAIRDGGDVAFNAVFHHAEGHVLQVVLPRLYVPESAEDGRPDRQATERVRLEARVATYGDYEGHDVVYGVDLASGGTTTMAPPTITTTAAA